MFYVCPFGSWIDKTISKSVSMIIISVPLCRLDGILNLLAWQWVDAFWWVHYCCWYRSISSSPTVYLESHFCYALISVSCFHQFVSSRGYGLPGYWFALVGFQWVGTGISSNYDGKIHPLLIWREIFYLFFLVFQARFFLTLQRLLAPDGVLFSEDLRQPELKELKAA